METPRTKGMKNFEAETLIRENDLMQKEIFAMQDKIQALKEKIKNNEPLILKNVNTNGNMILVLTWIELNISVKNAHCGEIVVGINKCTEN